MQTYANHRRWWPPWHFFAMPILGVNLIVVAVQFARNPSLLGGWNLLVWIALVVALVGARYMPLRVQDRVICMEERTRLERLLPPALRARIPELRRRQLIALRFAPDAEIPDLAHRVLSGELTSPPEIKRAITQWRADHLRV
ncbi:MAG TPA: DUF6526 family protein [Gemmatimonadaceae bacterium]|nr:DUF6526 family protein [Gemmatimonadaceae bacterium]